MDKEFYVYTLWFPQFMLDSIEAAKDIGYHRAEDERVRIEPP